MLLGISGRLLKTMSINSGKSSYRLTVWLYQPISAFPNRLPSNQRRGDLCDSAPGGQAAFPDLEPGVKRRCRGPSRGWQTRAEAGMKSC